MTCVCVGAGYCPVYDREMSPRMVHICQGEALMKDGSKMPDNDCNIMRANWLAEAWNKGHTESMACAHRGDRTGTKTCNTCGHRGQKVPEFYCTLHGRCTLKPWMVGQQEAICSHCLDRKSLKPKMVDRLRIDSNKMLPSPYQFNNSLISYKGRFLMAYRVGWENARLAILEMTADGTMICNSWLSFKNGRAQEDPRLFIYQDQLYISFSAVMGGESKMWTDVCYAKLEEKNGFWETAEEFCPKYAGRQLWEKNWGFFEYEGDLLCVYSISPHKVLKIQGNRSFCIAETPNPIRKIGMLHGGAPPVFHRGEYYCFYHRRLGLSSEKFYSLDLYTFEGKPPFRPSRHIESSLLIPNKKDRPGPTVPHAIFPGGAFIDELHRWNVSFGYYDKWSEIAWWSINQIESCLVSLPGGPLSNIAYRQGTNDLAIWKEVYYWGEYDLPENFDNSDVIIDIGAHIGSFSRACLDRGAGYVIAIEPFADSYNLLKLNLAYYPQRHECLKFGLGNSYKKIQLHNSEKNGQSYVAVSAHFGKGDVVAESDCHPLSYIITPEMQVRMIKIDCEGAEYEIFETSGDISNVKEIVGEAHRIQRDGVELDMPYLQKLLEKKHFQVESKVISPITWLFRAVR